MRSRHWLLPVLLLPLACRDFWRWRSSSVHELSEQTGRYIRVIGWYHSHPHITVWPSHVDVGTQASYQLLDDCFLGLIVSCFAKEGADTDTGQIRMTCFQARSTSSQDPVYIPLFVARNDPSLLAVASHGQLGLVRTLLEEEATRFGATKGDSVLSTLAANSRHSEHLCKLYDCISQPLESALQAKLEQNKRQLALLEAELQSLPVAAPVV
eukprot:m.208543 g.208543  ORF g.208543 m.208543 type:complete len:211 (-) comp10717_c0_seq23:458-1090(-)